jgi:hypothetical protein
MSSIKSLFEVYRPKPKDEQDFVDKHVVIKHKDENGNGDDVFNASKVKPIARKKTRLGYDAPEDEKVYEEIDLDEDQMIDAIVEMAELEGLELTDEEIVDILTQVKEGFDPSSEDIAKMLVKKHGKNVTKAHIDDINRDSRGSLDHEEIMQHVKKLTEGYVNLAQQRAVWATRNDGGKGHPDNKKKMKKEEVEDIEEVALNTQKLKALSIQSANPRKIDPRLKNKYSRPSKNRVAHSIGLKGITDVNLNPQKKRSLRYKTNTVGLHREERDDTMEKTEMAQTQLHFIGYAVKEILDYIKMGGDVEEWYQNKLSKVHSDIESLHSYVEGEKRRGGMVKEDADQINEILKSSTPMKTYIKDFQKSDAPQFKGKSQEKRRQMAIAAKLSNEEVELDEGLMHDRYMRSHGKKARGTGSWAFTTKQYGSPKEKDMHFTSGQKTLSDAHKEASVKLGTKNLYVMEEVDQIDEAINFTALDAVTKGHDGKSYSAMFDAHGSSIHNKIKAVRKERDNQPGTTKHATFLHDKMLQAYASWYKNKKDVKEEVEQIDEIGDTPDGRKTLASYIPKSANKMAQSHERANRARRDYARASAIHDLTSSSDAANKAIAIVRKDAAERETANNKDVQNRQKGIERAVKRLAKEAADEVPFEGPYKKTGTVRKDEYGNVIQNVPRHLANKAMKSLKKEDVINRAIDKYLPEEVKYTLEERFAIKIQNVPEMHQDTLIELFGGLSESNQKSMLLQLSEDDGVSKLLDFAIKNRGE